MMDIAAPKPNSRRREGSQAFACPAGPWERVPNPRAVQTLALLCALLLAWSSGGLCASPIPPTNLDRPDYDYSNVTCTSCHFIDGYDHTARAAGLQFNNTTNLWERTGHGWWDSRHAQSQYGWSKTATNYGWMQPVGPYGETDNTFCAFCHSPLQADGTATFSNGTVVNPVTVSTFQGVTCSSCHTSTTVAAQLLKLYPNAESGGETATLIRGQDPTKASSWIPILPGQENKFCLSCHEQDPHNASANSTFQVMYDAGVTCIDCHMAPYIVGVAGNTTGTPVGLTERFHDWKVAENLPYSCGTQGSLNQFTCHSEFTPDSARAFIPLMTVQHSGWWSLPPFSGPASAVSAHEMNEASDQLALWREIQTVYGRASRRETGNQDGARMKTAAATQ